MLKNKTDKLKISLMLIVIATFFLSQNYLSQNTFSQNDQGSTGEILSCDFVQFCSNPVEITRNSSDSSLITPSEQVVETTQTAPEDETQFTTGTPELIPDVTSNISLIMTPDLPENLATEDFQNPVDPSLQSTNETIEAAINDTPSINLGIIPENATVITPSSEISPTIEENITITLQNETGNNTGIDLGNITEPSNNITPENLTSPVSQNQSQMIPANETIDSTAANETLISPQEPGQAQNNVTTTIAPQSSPESSSENQPSPTAFLDQIINPFKELFGIK